jgi:Uma2 family endonuclease
MTSMAAPSRSDVMAIRYGVPRSRPDWTLPEEPVPESQSHDQTLDLLKALLLAWIARTQRSALVARNLAVRWDEAHPKVGLDPDLCVISPRPPDADALTSLCTWRPGHATPALAVEVVSASHPYKDYVVAPEKYAACGVAELWIFDPHLEGPKHAGGPHRIQIWRRDGDEFARVFAGEGPAWSEAVRGWLFATSSAGGGERLRISDDEAGTRWWRTGEEAERAAKEAERAGKEAALARVAELEAKLRAIEPAS